MLIDCHVHLNNYYTENGDNRRPTEDNVHRLWDAMAANGVDHAVVLTSYKVNVDRPSVEHVLEILAEDPRTTVVRGSSARISRTCSTDGRSTFTLYDVSTTAWSTPLAAMASHNLRTFSSVGRRLSPFSV
ncbi:MAG TPA: hypothetical protein VLA36_00380 [Longimicrobiales bacterium]|nr:hypothetical protein [Longimicrobiales bacterium]